MSAATTTPGFTARRSRSSRRRTLRPTHEAAREADKPGHGHGTQESLVVNSKPAIVFCETCIHQSGNADIDADLFCSRDREIVVLLVAAHVPRRADAFPDEIGPDAEAFQVEEGPAPPRQIRAMPCGPVHEEQ